MYCLKKHSKTMIKENLMDINQEAIRLTGCRGMDGDSFISEVESALTNAKMEGYLQAIEELEGKNELSQVS